MKYHTLADHPYFPLLLLWRGILAVLALYSVLYKPFEAMLMALAVLGLCALFGEAVSARKVQADNERLRRQAEREWRERRAEEARRRLAAAKDEGVRKGFGLDDDGEPEVGDAAAPGLPRSAGEGVDLVLDVAGRDPGKAN